MIYLTGWIAEMSKTFNLLIPIVLVIFLLFLIFLLFKLIKFIDELSKTVLGLNQTITTVDKSLDKLQKPLDTVFSIANTVDVAHNTTLNLTGKLIDFIKDNYVSIKEFFQEIFKKDVNKEEDSSTIEKEE